MLLQEAKKKYAAYPEIKKIETVDVKPQPVRPEEKTADSKQADIDAALEALHKAVEAL